MTDTAQGGPMPSKTGGANGDFKNPGGEIGPFTQEQQMQKADKKDDGLPGHAWKQKKG